MKLFLTVVCAVLSCCVMTAQDLPPEAMRHYRRADIALRLAETAEDYKVAVEEYEAAIAYAPESAELHYRLAVCCEAVAKADGTYFVKAAQAYSKALDYGYYEFDASLLLEISAKADEMSDAALDFVSVERISPESLCGRWLFHDSDGERNDLYDITISENHGMYTVEFTQVRSHGGVVEGDIFKRQVNILVDGNKIYFSTIHNEQWYVPENSYYRETRYFKKAFNYELALVDGRLEGISTTTLSFLGLGASGYRNVRTALDDGCGAVLEDCSGNCGSSEVYFVRF